MNPTASGPDTLQTLIASGKGHVHFAGICGVGMAGLAVLLKARGFRVSGCDLMINKLAGWLRERGIPVSEKHAPEHIGADVAWVVRSAAVPPDAPEVQAAVARGVPVFKRGEVLPALLQRGTSVTVAGTHGKTTTTSFIAQVLVAAGGDPSFCIGGEAAPLGGVARAGKGEMTVVEADESDGTLALYTPDVAVVTNVDFDHMEHFASVAAFEDCFRTYIRQTRRRVVYCADDPRAARLAESTEHAWSYGLSAAATYRAVALKEQPAATEFTVMQHEVTLGTFCVPAPGRHNVLNALACIAVGLELGIDVETLRTGLARVALPRRRFDRLIDRDDVIVISDYAHHPAEITALVRAAQHLHRPRLLGVFQPHRYTRTLALGPDFPGAFEGLAELVLLPVYAASEQPLPGGTVWDLYRHCRAHGTPPVSVASSLRQAWDYCRGQLRLGDGFLVIGAGDVERIATWAHSELRETRVEELGSLLGQAARQLTLDATLVKGNEPLAARTTLKVGGRADLWMDVGSEHDLQAVVRWCGAEALPFTVLGGGSNVLVDDLGVRGVVARLGGEAFRRIGERDDLVVAGAGASLAALVDWTAEHGLAGLENLEGIPGTVGGAVHGNAGAFGMAIGDHIAWVRGFDRDGAALTLQRAQLDFAYRCCPRLAGCIIVEAAFRLTADDATRIRERRRDASAHRAWMKGLRSAGSVFKNPPGDYAGRLIEQAGLKGYSVGGARISERHANVIVTEAGAQASDVMAVLEHMRSTVQRQFGVMLETEVALLG